MKFLSIFKTVEHHVSQEEMAKMGKLVEEGLKAGTCWGPRVVCRARWGRAFGGSGKKWS